MSDHADVIRELICLCPDVVANKPTRKDLAYRALDALVAERDNARRDEKAARQLLGQPTLNARTIKENHRLSHALFSAEAERDELKNKLAVQQNWETLYEREKARVTELEKLRKRDFADIQAAKV